jgi:adenylate kinase
MTSTNRVIFLTGTPGVGKTTLTNLIEKNPSWQVIKINQLAEERNLFSGTDKEKGYKIIDLDVLCPEIESIISEKSLKKSENIVIDGHLSHFCPGADLVIVLRVHPSVLKERLIKRDYSASKIQENLEAEALGVCSMEAMEIYGNKVHEIDASQLSPDEVLKTIIQVFNGEKMFPVGKVDFLDWIIS